MGPHGSREEDRNQLIRENDMTDFRPTPFQKRVFELFQGGASTMVMRGRLTHEFGRRVQEPEIMQALNLMREHHWRSVMATAKTTRAR